MKKFMIILSALAILFTGSTIAKANAAEKVIFGSYPQTEVSGSDLTKDIMNASYDSSGKAVVNGNTYYKLTWKYDMGGSKVQLSSPKYYKCEPISWKVMSKGSGESKLIAENALDAGIYSGSDNAEYASSLLKEWMEETFYNIAFNTAEKAAFISGTKPQPPTFADIISVTYGFASNIDRCVSATDYADCISNKSHSSSVNYWIQSGYIGTDGSANTVISGKGIYRNLYYSVPTIRIQETAMVTVSPTPSPITTPSITPATQSALAVPVYVKVKNIAAERQKITWGKSGDAISYIIYRSTTKNGKYKKIGSTKKSYYTSKKLIVGKTYYYKVVAVNGTIQSKPSKPVFKKAGIPNKPRLTATKTKKGIICRWTNLTGAEGIVLYDRINKSSFAKIYDGTLTNKTKKGCILHPSNASGKMYIKIRVYNKNHGKKYYSPYSKTISIRI